MPKKPAPAGTSSSAPITNEKLASLERDRVHQDGTTLTTDHGLAIPHTDDSLKAGVRGPTLLEDFHLREKITRFDHERIPERVVHARGSGAHGVFRLTESLADLTTAEFLCDTSLETPVFVRFSTVQGARGSPDTVRDVRGFATKFYTRQGNVDLVANNFPIFFIQDGIKFPDVVHAVKPEPHHEMPQAASAHDTFWDFCGLATETAHMVMWLMSDRGVPRSFSTMEGFGVHTFRLVKDGKSTLVKFHWKPLLGVQGLAWDEAQKIAGKDIDFNRREMWESIEAGNFFEYDLGIQIVDDDMAAKIGADLLDVTKIIPEEIAPVRRVGRMTLNRNPDNFFAETEQVAFCVANVVPGIDFTNDAMLIARMFSYVDTQITRLGGPNHAQLPINRPIVPVHNHQQDGFGNQTIPTSRANYTPNSIGGGCPFPAKTGGYVHLPVEVSGPKTRERSPSFADHFSQAAMFFHSMADWEKEHITQAYAFELSKCVRKEVRERYVNDVLANIDTDLAKTVAAAIGVPFHSKSVTSKPKLTSPALSATSSPKGLLKGRRVAILVAQGADSAQINAVIAELAKGGAVPELVAPALGAVVPGAPEATKTIWNTSSVLWDAIYVPGGQASVDALRARGDVAPFLKEAFRHSKPIGGSAEGADFVESALLEDIGAAAPKGQPLPGVVLARAGQVASFPADFVKAVGQYRFWERSALVPPRT